MTETPHLSVVKGGKITQSQFQKLSLPEKLAIMAGRPPRERLDLIISDPAGKELVQAMSAFDLYLLVKEIGENDAVDLIAFASPEQVTFFLDIEAWNSWSFSVDKGLLWLQRLLDGGENVVSEFVSRTDPELLTLILMKEITVGGGTGELLIDDERLTDWDHSFDQLYFISFKNSRHSRMIGKVLDIMFREHHSFYVTVMERIKTESFTEMEDACYESRAGRLADMGIPDPAEARSIYAFVNPDTFVLHEEGKLEPAEVGTSLTVPVIQEDLLLHRALALTGSQTIFSELNYLINNALMADPLDFDDAKAREGVFQRVYGYLNMAVEYLSGNDEEKAAEILRNERLIDLFRLGFSLILKIQRQTAGYETADYAVGKLLAGLRSTRPRFYRALDPDGVDAYREFLRMEDLRTIAATLG